MDYKEGMTCGECLKKKLSMAIINAKLSLGVKSPLLTKNKRA